MTVKTGFGDEPAVPTIDRDTCTACGLCVEICKAGTLSRVDGAVKVDPNAGLGCIGCGQCAMICPTGSMTVTGRRVTPEDLVDLPPPGARASAESLEALLLARRSARDFDKRDVPREVVDRILRAASTAPMGIPPSDVEVLVFHGREKVQALAADATEAWGRMSNFMSPVVLTLMRPFMKRALIDLMKSFLVPAGHMLVEKRRQGEDWVLYDAPLAMLFHLPPEAGGELTDATIACTYAMLEAEALGLGTCMIGSVGPMLASRKPLMDKYGLPRDHKPGLVLIAGYPSPRMTKFRKAIRRPLAGVRWA
jgi:nitroreductase/NAD-dependent dihydropyrimidine dehydrogenase PreA subunit